MNRSLLILLFSVCLIVAGCGDGATSTNNAALNPQGEVASPDPGPVPFGQTEPPVEKETSTDETPVSVPPAEPAETGEPVEPVNEDDVKLAIASWDEIFEGVTKHPGKVVVVDVWSTSCPPCVAEFPNLVKMQRELGNKVVCVSVSVDYLGLKSKPVETYVEPVRAFLVKQGATFTNYLCNEDTDVLSESGKLSSLPSIIVYDARGEVAARFDEPTADGKEHTYAEHIRPFVERLLKVNPPPSVDVDEGDNK